MTRQNTPLPPADDPYGQMAREFFRASWANFRDGLLRKTDRLRLTPDDPDCPCTFGFEIRTPFLRKTRFSSVEPCSGPIHGRIVYCADPFGAPPDVPRVVVLLDCDQALFHPNYSRRFGILCLGDLQPVPLELTHLVPHVYGILTYENVGLASPADPEAATYFASVDDPLRMLPPVAPLFGPMDPNPRQREPRTPRRRRE